MGVLERAAAHLRRQRALARRAALEVAKLWARVDRAQIAASWSQSIPAALTVVESAQAVAAASAGPYLDDLLVEYGLPDGLEGRIRVDGFVGMASDGRLLSTLLEQPAIAALKALKKGATERRARASGRFALDMIVRTQVADAGRVADGVALTARPQLAGWVRMLTLPSCARCVLLAGKFYRWNDGFLRHERCDCRHIAAPEDAAGDLRTDPHAYFRSLSDKEQDRIFTEAGAQAIRDGADIFQVVNARRGMSTAGGKRFTSVGTSRRGLAGRRLGAGRGRAVRVTPEQIYADADGDRDAAIRSLRLHGYII